MTDLFKESLRKVIRLTRKQLSKEFQRHISLNICSAIESIPHYQSAKRIGLYHAIQGEVSLESLWKQASLQGKKCFFPSLNADKTLSFWSASSNDSMIKNRFGILEPNTKQAQFIYPHELDVLFMPLVAFDAAGNRIGMGQGYYDRTLHASSPKIKIGVAYEFQKQPFINPSSWDIPLTAIITEKTIYWSK